jgi:hypothetical protein
MRAGPGVEGGSSLMRPEPIHIHAKEEVLVVWEVGSLRPLSPYSEVRSCYWDEEAPSSTSDESTTAPFSTHAHTALLLLLPSFFPSQIKKPNRNKRQKVRLHWTALVGAEPKTEGKAPSCK